MLSAAYLGNQIDSWKQRGLEVGTRHVFEEGSNHLGGH
jgi:hypothetical protein